MAWMWRVSTFSHGDHEEHMGRYGDSRERARGAGTSNCSSAGHQGAGDPHRRCCRTDKKVTLEAGELYTLTTEEIVGDDKRGFINYAGLPADVAPGNKILIDDGLIELDVEEVKGNRYCL